MSVHAGKDSRLRWLWVMAYVVSLALFSVACSESSVGSVGDSTGDIASGEIGLDAQAPDVADVAEAEVLEDAGGDVADTVDAIDTSKPEWGECVDGGEAGCPCDVPDDCYSGFCITTGDGKVCTSTCDSVCPEGWRCADVTGGGGDITYICVPLYTNLCRPCDSGEDCAQMGGTGGYCVPFAGGAGSFCSADCDQDESCPAGYTCESVSLSEDETVSQCMPETGFCECNQKAMKEGASTDCLVQNEIGACPGTLACSLDGLGECEGQIPAAEDCNGIDDNCDGIIDDITEGECLIENEFGACPGTQTCINGGWSSCIGTPPVEEICDAEDNDCDGNIDEGFTDTNLNGIADCVDPDDDGDAIADDGDNCPLVPNPDQGDMDGDQVGDACDDDIDGDDSPNDEDCDPLDGDYVCTTYYYDSDGDGAGQCDATLCACEPSGKYTVTECEITDCDDGNELVKPGLDEICDGLDNNCDGHADEGVPDSNNNGIWDVCDGDSDGDGHLDVDDNCPNDANADQLDGDLDGLGDACDPDDDDDGFLDEADNCPTVFNPNQLNCDGDEDGDVCDDDDDNDGVGDALDCAICDAAIYPGAFDGCNNIDDDCDGAIDEDCAYGVENASFGSGFVTGGSADYEMFHRLGTTSFVGTTQDDSYVMVPGILGEDP